MKTKEAKKRRKSDVEGYYQILGVDHNATQEEVRSIGRRKLAELHPDNGGNVNDFINAAKAYAVLSQNKSRIEYDRKTIADSIIRVSAKPTLRFKLPQETDKPMWWKEPQDLLEGSDIELVAKWQGMLLETAYEFGAALDIKAGISKSLAGYDDVDGIAVIGASESVPQRWAANVFILKEMIKNGS